MLGIGHVLRGDDAAGPQVVERLRELPADDYWLILEGGSAPENCTGPLRRFGPDWVLLVDAAEMGLPPGSVCWLPWEETTGISASTHTLPVYMLAHYLVQEMKCKVALIGIQPRGMSFSAALSEEVQQAVDQIVEVLAHIDQ